MSREQKIVVNGVRLWTVSQGKGMPMVLCHGGPGLYDYLQPMAAMADDLCDVLRYDQRGCGRSEPMQPYNVETFVDDLEAMRGVFGYRKWIVGGHSWGADLALAYASQYPQHTQALVYVSGRGIDPAWNEAYHAKRLSLLNETDREAYESLRERRDGAFGEEYQRIVRELRGMNRKIDVYDQSSQELQPTFDKHPINDEINRLVNEDWEKWLKHDNFKARATDLEIPALFIHGRHDPRDKQYAEQLALVMKHGEFHIIEKAGHYPYLEQPEAFKTLLRDFLDRVIDTSQ